MFLKIKPPFKIFFPIAMLLVWVLWYGDVPQQLLFKTVYDCETQGYSYRYKDGVRQNEAVPDVVRFELTTYRYARRFKLQDNSVYQEHQNPHIVRNWSGSTPVEDLYIDDVTDSMTQERTQTSLVLNTTSGDIRLMYHRWIPPNGWQNSVLYFFSGFCIAKKEGVQKS